MEARIKRGNNTLMKNIIELKHENSWATQNNQIKQEMKVTDSDLTGSCYSSRKILKQKAKGHHNNNLTITGSDKSKIKFLKEGYKGHANKTVGTNRNYMKLLTRNQCSTIFKARTRMIKVKDNYKNAHKTVECRLCKKTPETQQHILEECETVHAPGS